MKIGSAQFPPFEPPPVPRSNDPAEIEGFIEAYARILAVEKNSSYVEGISPLCYRLDEELHEWRRLRVFENLKLGRIWRGYNSRKAVFWRSVTKAIHLELPDFFINLTRRILFLREAEMRQPDHRIARKLRGRPSEYDPGRRSLPMAGWVWQKEKLCVLWVDVPLTKRLLGKNDAEFVIAADPLENMPVIVRWLRSEGMIEYDIFLRYKFATSFGTNLWTEISSDDDGGAGAHLNVREMVSTLWILLRIAGTPATQEQIKELADPLDEPWRGDSPKRIADKALILAGKLEISMDVAAAEEQRKSRGSEKAALARKKKQPER